MLDAQGPSSNKWDKAKQQAKAVAEQAKAKFNKYKDSDQAKEHVAKGKELMISEKAQNVAKALGAGVLSVIVSGQAGKMMDLNSKADVLNKLDATAVAERTVSDNAVQVSKSQIANFTQYGGIGQKSMAQTLKEAGQKEMDKEIEYQKGVLGNMQQLQNNDSNIEAKKSEINSREADRARLEQESQDFTTDGNQFGNAIKGANSNTFRGGEFGDNFGQKAEALKSKLASHDELKKENQRATDKYYQGNTMNPALEATQQSKEAQGDAAKTFVIGGLAGGAFAFSRKKKGEQAPSKEEPKTEPNPEPIPQALETKQVETVTEAVQAIEGIETVTPPTFAEKEEAIKINEETQESISRVKKGIGGKDTGFTADEYSPKEAPAPKEAEKVPFWKKAGKLATQLTMGAAAASAIKMGPDIAKIIPNFNQGGANIENVNKAETGGRDIANEQQVWGKQSAKEAYLSSKQSEINSVKHDIDVRMQVITHNFPGNNFNSMAAEMEKAKITPLRSKLSQLDYELKTMESENFDGKLSKFQVDLINKATEYSGTSDVDKTNIKAFLDKNQSLPSTETAPAKVDISTETPGEPDVAETSNQAAPVAAESTVPAVDLVGATQTPPIPNTIPAEPAKAVEAAPVTITTEAPPVDYTIAKAKLEKLASQSEIGKQMKEYTGKITTELITNLSATLAQKGSTMAPADVQILTAKINALKYIKSHNGDSIYIPIAESAKPTFATAATGNPESIFGKVRYGNLNKTDIATKDFDGVNMVKTFAEKGITNVQAHLDEITAARSNR
jgi:hypothetical protein